MLITRFVIQNLACILFYNLLSSSSLNASAIEVFETLDQKHETIIYEKQTNVENELNNNELDKLKYSLKSSRENKKTLSVTLKDVTFKDLIDLLPFMRKEVKHLGIELLVGENDQVPTMEEWTSFKILSSLKRLHIVEKSNKIYYFDYSHIIQSMDNIIPNLPSTLEELDIIVEKGTYEPERYRAFIPTKNPFAITIDNFCTMQGLKKLALINRRGDLNIDMPLGSLIETGKTLLIQDLEVSGFYLMDSRNRLLDRLKESSWSRTLTRLKINDEGISLPL